MLNSEKKKISDMHELWNRTSIIEGMYEGELGYECVDGKSFRIKAFFARLWGDCE